MQKRPRETSWQGVGKWYNALVADKGHYYHEHVVLPGALRLLNLEPDAKLLDLACGQGVLSRSIPKSVSYVGIDAAKNLIDAAKKLDHNPNHSFIVADVTKPLPMTETDFTHATIILAIQNIEYPQAVLDNAAKHLVKNGMLVIVLNHPCFRIPRQSSWGIDETNKLEYRRINRYKSPLKIPISMHPGQAAGPLTWSFHLPLESYSQHLEKAGFVMTKIEEWTSDKVSVGKASKMENRSRSEFPLFLTVVAKKI